MSVPSTSEYVCHGVTWSSGQPRLLLAPAGSGPLVPLEFMDQWLGLRITSTKRHCTGRFRFVDPCRVEPVSCPDQSGAVQNGQCVQCAQEDEFRFAHQFHQSGHGPPALARYMSQPHWLYIATFADGTSKVGTAAEWRKRSRLDEQGALFATYLGRSENGRSVRYLEDAVTRHLDVAQSMRGAAKLAALADLRSLDKARDAHEHTTRRTFELLAGLGTDPALEQWSPPTEGYGLRRPGERVRYPHDLRKGEHGFHVEACIGSQALARLSETDSMRYVLDLGTLKGRRIALGDFSSPEVAVQAALF
ncbi:DUF2797 domain-containing protein [Nocardiopsis sp. HUAS JQ3]|uniref:DUF2797 domain-containing protein n=1 Tax=Nocardiopsis sp. HUAS JQ3 TaxID=3061629 RepID=UPI0023A9F54B|nr:DUF2797 domain-containing protein [Nocardiopsis sp. HUAS JQ3]WDZ90590.1 DUF2797 domain-containing protein [Nocardiopsis sp. HUAS JQ3]